ncbi:hypothetical protein SZ64_17805 [Erythrobacter sp. SG61-1L]|uniref:hypothetical protein n=1 Tax=Erythrobacter sp. SG61-1L TaxID=1603897 RepID=UPI0006C90655|nr:hypothetical protein [Erythrobacter sp. SG61-1L]KPL69757.1 hypothetical protein SZ64_17640 [Erythrobacter sp. SG61-1L]KPL69790.1 hypothetical protein SZ64_17805 [Erythrobacter sp. SG61-1L]
MHWKAILGAVTVCALQVPAAAEDIAPSPAEAEVPYAAETARAEKLGLQMYLYDQAAWLATDSFLPDMGKLPQKQLRGYVVVPGQGDRLEAVFYGEVDGELTEFARYDVDKGKVVSGGILAKADRVALSPLAKRLADARAVAIDEVIAKSYGFCSDQQPNTLTLPPDENNIVSVYVMTPPVTNDSYPLGGHYRVDVDAQGKAIHSRRFLNSCFEVQYRNAKDENGKPMEPTALVVTHLLDPYPTEIHAFASRYLPVELMVVTVDNKAMWSVVQGDIAYAGQLSGLDEAED